MYVLILFWVWFVWKKGDEWPPKPRERAATPNYLMIPASLVVDGE